MGSELHIFLFPLMAQGHTIPIVDMAKLFASRGVKITIVTTPLNSIPISRSIHTTNSLAAATPIELLVLKFPSAEAGLPDGVESVDSIPGPHLMPNFFKAMSLLQAPLEQAMMEKRPHCLVADMFHPWANDAAAKVGIPRLTFHGTGFFCLSSMELMRLHEPQNHVSSDTEPFLVPDLPGDGVKFTKLQLPEDLRLNVKTYFSEFLNKVHESELECYGVVVNSFYELERDYADCFRNVLGRKAWHIGPLSLCNKETDEKMRRSGREFAIDEHECLKWLDLKKPNSVVYVCFGSLTKFNSAQLKEIANGLEASAQAFIWVVRRGKEEEDDEDWLPEGFEKRMEGKGLIIRGWAPQVLILDHPAVGGFVTHCGWNSILEGVAAGVPMVTWPFFADQFYNEKLVTRVLKTGVGVGAQKWVAIDSIERDFIGREAVEKAIRRVMEGEEAEEMRNKARGLAEMARRTVAENGSSSSDLDALIKELKSSAL